MAGELKKWRRKDMSSRGSKEEERLGWVGWGRGEEKERERGTQRGDRVGWGRGEEKERERGTQRGDRVSRKREKGGQREETERV